MPDCEAYIFYKARKFKLCMMHFIAEYPNTELTKRLAFKERAILQAIATRYPDWHIVHNKQVSSCLNRRPDIDATLYLMKVPTTVKQETDPSQNAQPCGKTERWFDDCKKVDPGVWSCNEYICPNGFTKFCMGRGCKICTRPPPPDLAKLVDMAPPDSY